MSLGLDTLLPLFPRLVLRNLICHSVICVCSITLCCEEKQLFLKTALNRKMKFSQWKWDGMEKECGIYP